MISILIYIVYKIYNKKIYLNFFYHWYGLKSVSFPASYNPPSRFVLISYLGESLPHMNPSKPIPIIRIAMAPKIR